MVKKKISKIMELKEDRNTTQQYSREPLKAVLWVKCITLSTYIKIKIKIHGKSWGKRKECGGREKGEKK